MLTAAAMVGRGSEYLDTLRGQAVLVVGLARSGVAAARLARATGAEVLVTDAKPLTALGPGARALADDGVSFLPEAAAVVTARRVALVVVSPGVPLDAPVPAAARAAGIPVIGELELAWRAMEADTLAITGTNGKTTTTALTGAILAGQLRPVLVGGNIGTPLAARALEFPADGLVVAEVSSFQLETTEAFHPRVAAVLNLTPDHLDRHGSFEAYADAKARVFRRQGPADCAVLNADDAGSRALAPRTRADIVWFSRERVLDHGVFVRDGWIVAKLNGHAEEIGPVAEVPLRGRHNLENVLAAVAIALWTGMAPEDIRRGVARFGGVPHRIEFVRSRRGVGYYNDSKATNVDSTIKALESFEEPVVLIAGGRGKGQDFTPLASAAAGRVIHAVVLGEDGAAVARALTSARVPVTSVPTLAAAVETAVARAPRGAVVVLSPACASFDMFRDFEHRGDEFRSLVQALGA